MDLIKFYRALIPAMALMACNGNKTESTNEEIELVNKYTRGETYSIVLHWDEKISSTDSTGQTQLQEIKMENEMDYVVRDVDAHGVATISGKYASMKMGDFDSGDTSTYKSDMAMMWKMMSPKEIVMKVDPKGHVLEVTGAEGMFSMGMPDSPLDDNKIMQENIEGAIGIFPDKKVKKGDTWERTHTVSFGYPCIYHDKYTLKNTADGLATIEVSSNMEPNMDAPPTFFPNGVQLRQELNGTQSGTIVVDIAKGKIMTTDCRLNINGKAKGQIGNQPIEVVMSTELNVKTEVKLRTK